MILRVTGAKVVIDFFVKVSSNEEAGDEVDQSGELNGPVFAPLRDAEAFGEFRLDPDLHTLPWVKGADLAPELLHYLGRVLP